MNTSASQAGRSAARYFFLFLLGLAVGIIAVVMGMRAWEGKKTWQDRWHDAAMHMMQAHAGSLKDNVQQNRCSATDTLPHLLALRMVSNDIEPAFPKLSDDPRFTTAAGALRAKLDAALANPPLNCPGVGTALKAIGEACDGCHQDFRS